MTRNAAYWIRHLQLKRHPEGGYFRETYRAKDMVPANGLPRRFAGARCFSTAIHFLLCGKEVSHFHRIRSDELWHYYAGCALTMHVLDPAGQYKTVKLGPDPDRDEAFQAVMPAGHWFGATVNNRRSFALAGCTVAPGFDFADFELADRQQLLAQYPRHAEIIRRLTI